MTDQTRREFLAASGGALASTTFVAGSRAAEPARLTDIEWQLESARCRMSFSHFVKRFWPIIEPGTKLIWNWHLDAICSHLQAVDDGLFTHLIICIPPGFGKSTLVSCLWPAWSWLHRPWLRSLFGSYDEKLTYRDSVRCRDVIKSKLYQRMFNTTWKLRSDIISMGYFANTMHGARKTYYMGSSHKTGWRANYISVDDPISAENRYDNRIKNNVNETWDIVMSTRINDNTHYAFVVIMQRLADNDLVGYLIKKYGNKYIQLILPVEFDPATRCETPIFRDPRTYKGELLAPEFFSQRQLDDKKETLGVVDFDAQYNHAPHPLGGDRFKIEHFQYWKYSAISHEIIELQYRTGVVEYIRIRDCQRFLSVDFAATEEKEAENDFTVIGLWAITRRNEIILLYRAKLRARESTIISTLKEVYYMGQFGPVPPSTIYAESNGLGLPIAQNAQEAGLPVELVNVHKDKLVMSASAAVRIESGQMFFPDYSVYPWMPEFVAELVSFPAGEHDDSVSMISIASNSLFERHSGSPTSVVTVPQTKPRIDANHTQANLRHNNMFGVNHDQERINTYNGVGGNGNGSRRHT